jgi:nicotinamidase/pyrazinamidase
LNEAACRGIAPDTTKAALEKMKTAGVILVKNAAALKKMR